VEPDEGGGIYHFTRIMGCSLMLWRPVGPAVATVHDLGPLLWPPEREAGNILDLFLFHLSLLGLKRMDRIVADSHATAQSLIDLLGIPDERIVVVHLGVDRGLLNRVSEARVALEEKYSILGQAGVFNLLYVGSEAPRKNLATLLEALSKLKRSGIAARLIKVGDASHPRYRAVFLEQISRLGLDESVIIVGEVSDVDLPLLYSSADVFVLPSHVEGFGLPVLEAMACGTPVVCSNAGALPEVAGDAALLVSPDNVEGLANAIAVVLEDASLREQLVEKGLERSQRFTWTETVERTRMVYEEVEGG
jgi:glycosyltransferase involved in cell wall biosynthesis